MKVNEFVNTAIKIANSPTVYYSVAGGAWCKWNGSSWNMDCVCMIKGIVWGFNFNKSAAHGGAVINKSICPDVNADGLIKICKNVSTDFNNIEYGEVVHMAGHVGVYIGNGQVVESTAWYGKTIISNIGKDGKRTKDGNVGGYWQNHGKLPCVDYSVQPTPTPTTKYKVGDVVNINGVYVSSTSTEKLKPAVTKGTITKIVDARNPYLLDNGNIGWVNDSCIVNAPTVKYLNISPVADYRTVYKDSSLRTKAGEIKPKKYGGLSYKILGEYPNQVVKINTSSFGQVYISSKPQYYCTIDTEPKYQNGYY